MAQVAIRPTRSPLSILRQHALTEPFGLWEWPSPWLRFPEMFSRATMCLEEYEENGNLVIRAELPGIDPDKDVDIEIVGGLLRVTAERKETARDRSGYRSEMYYGAYARSIALPEGTSEKDVKATYKNGILEVRLPMTKTQEIHGTKVPVTRG
jgi:HSP20 family protein